MLIRRLDLNNFRLFQRLDVKFDDGINLITGRNGCGKTSVLESIYFLALTKSFRTPQYSHVIHYNSNNFSVSGNIESGSKKNHLARIYFSEKEGKHMFLDGQEIKNYADYIGFIPCVLLQPDDIKLTLGAPADRRRFMDILLSQISPLYLEDLRMYKRVLLQRNALLSSDDKTTIKNQIEIWNKQLVEHGSKLIERRLALVKFLNENSASFYNDFSEKSDKISVSYNSTILGENKDLTLASIQGLFRKKLAMLHKYELYKKTTAAGPHRDDIVFYKNNKSFKEYGSQGENKSLIIALKLLEWKYLSESQVARPVLLFDDIFGELDQTRMKGLLRFLKDVGQTFITTTLENKFSPDLMDNRIRLEELVEKNARA